MTTEDSLKAIVRVLKARFTNLGVEETIGLAFAIAAALGLLGDEKPEAH